MKTQQAISGTSAATCQLMEPHWTHDVLATMRQQAQRRFLVLSNGYVEIKCTKSSNLLVTRAQPSRDEVR